MRHWTEADKKRQAQLIRAWRPWRKVGTKSPAARAAVRGNALKHGYYAASSRSVRRYFTHCRRTLQMIDMARKSGIASGLPLRLHMAGLSKSPALVNPFPLYYTSDPFL